MSISSIMNSTALTPQSSVEESQDVFLLSQSAGAQSTQPISFMDFLKVFEISTILMGAKIGPLTVLATRQPNWNPLQLLSLADGNTGIFLGIGADMHTIAGQAVQIVGHINAQGETQWGLGSGVKAGGFKFFYNIRASDELINNAMRNNNLTEFMPGGSRFGEPFEILLPPGLYQATAGITVSLAATAGGVMTAIPATTAAGASTVAASKLADFIVGGSGNVQVRIGQDGKVESVLHNGRPIDFSRVGEPPIPGPIRDATIAILNNSGAADGLNNWIAQAEAMLEPVGDQTLNWGNPTHARINNGSALSSGDHTVWELAAVSNGLNHGDPALEWANKFRAAISLYGNKVMPSLDWETRAIVRDGVYNAADFSKALNAIYPHLSPADKAALVEYLTNPYFLNGGLPDLDAANRARYGSQPIMPDHNRVRNLLTSLDNADPNSLNASLDALFLGDGNVPETLGDASQLSPADQLALERQMLGDAPGVGVTPADPLPSANAQAAQIASYVHQFTSLASQFTPIPGMVLNATGLTAAGLALNAKENPTFGDAIPMLRQILSMIPLDDDIEKAISVAGTAWDIGSAVKSGDWGNVAMIAAQVAAGQIGPRTEAGVAAGLALVDVVANVNNPVKLGLAVVRFGLAMNNFVNTFNRVRVDMGEVDVGNGVKADVRYQGFTSSTGPEYRFVLSGDQDNLPPLQSAAFSLRRADDGSFRFEGSGSRAPFGIGVEALGLMTTPEAPSDPEGLRQPRSLFPGMLQPFHIDTDLAHRLITANGGRQTFSNIDASFPLFHEIEALFDAWKLDAVYTTDAKKGLPQVVDAGFGEFGLVSFPNNLPQVDNFNDQVVAHFMQPGLFGHKFTFRDMESAALFQAAGLDIVSLIASAPDLIQAFGPGRDLQGMIDYVLGNPDRPMPSDLFNIFAYAAANPDLRAHFDERDAMGLALHYITAGYDEGRMRHADPAAAAREFERYLNFSAFDDAIYRRLYPDVASAIDAGQIASARDHFRAHGFEEGRLPSFNQDLYLAMHPDVAEAVGNGSIESGIDHWVRHGQYEGRSIMPAAIDPFSIQQPETAPDRGFDERAYLAANADVAAAIANGTMDSAYGHFQRHGAGEGRQFFDEQAYLAQHQGVAEAVANGTMDSALGHWERHGQYEGFGIAVSQNAPIAPVAEAPPAPAPTFEEAYFAANPDVAASGMSAADHYHSAGAEEGRTW